MSPWAAALCMAAMLAVADGCIYMWGNSPNSLAKQPNGTHWNHRSFGADWDGETDAVPWVCNTGAHQSPINIPIDQAVNGDYSLRTKWSYPPVTSDGSNIDIINNGHVIQVEWRSNQSFNMSIVADAAEGANIVSVLDLPNADAGTKVVTAHPVQFHFHTSSEHYMYGSDYPMELHIVQTLNKSELAACDPKCYAVTGILLELRDGPDNPAFDFIFNNIPLREGAVSQPSAGAVLNFSKILPAEGNQGYYQYYGSLTTPPCSEGLLWHVFEQPNYISRHQYQQLMTAINDKDCTPAEPGEKAITGVKTANGDVLTVAGFENATAVKNAQVANGVNGARRLLAAADSHTHAHAPRKLATTDNSGTHKKSKIHAQKSHSHANKKSTAHRDEPSHANLVAALSTLPHSFEISASQLHNLRHHNVGQAIEESSPLHRLLVENGGEPTNMVCVIHAYAQNFRLVQPINGRIVKYFADAEANREYNCSNSMPPHHLAMMTVNGTEIKTMKIISDGFKSQNQGRNEQECKNNCDKEDGCTGYLYKSNRDCTLFTNTTGLVPAVGDNLTIYDSCHVVEA